MSTAKTELTPRWIQASCNLTANKTSNERWLSAPHVTYDRQQYYSCYKTSLSNIAIATAVPELDARPTPKYDTSSW